MYLYMLCVCLRYQKKLQKIITKKCVIKNLVGRLNIFLSFQNRKISCVSSFSPFSFSLIKMSLSLASQVRERKERREKEKEKKEEEREKEQEEKDRISSEEKKK